MAIAKAAGVKDEQIILDPGVGFGKTYENNLTVIHHLERLVETGYRVLLATSRKSVIGLTLGLPTEERVEGTLVTTVLGVQKHASFVRVHDVKEKHTHDPHDAGDYGGVQTGILNESSKSPASIAWSNKQWVGTCLYQEWYKPLLISCEAATRL